MGRAKTELAAALLAKNARRDCMVLEEVLMTKGMSAEKNGILSDAVEQRVLRPDGSIAGGAS